MEGLMAQKDLRNLARVKMLQDRGALPKEQGDIVREYKAMHKENFLSSCLREDVEGKEQSKNQFNRKTNEEVSRKRDREGEKGEDGTMADKFEGVSTLFRWTALDSG